MDTKKGFTNFIFSTIEDNKPLFARLIVGLIFLSEGIQKYLFPDTLGPGRFLKIGFGDPAFWAYFTAAFEVICGFLVFIGLLTRLASIPLFIIMMTAFVTTKWPMLMDKGFWVMVHEYRTDFALTILLIFLFSYGSGRWSIDTKIGKVPKR